MLSKRSHYSLTLVELLVTVIIVAILVSLGVGQYVKIIPKAKAAKAKHTLALISEAAKMYRMDAGFYRSVAAGAVEAAIGSGVTGMNLAAVDNDADFDYSVTAGAGSNIISADNPAVIGSCAVNTSIEYDLDSGAINVPPCYE